MIQWLNDVFTWYNLIFVLGFVIMGLYAFLTMVGGIAGGENVDINTDHDFHVGDGGVDASHEVSADHDAAGHEFEHGGLWGFRGFLGIGKVPMIVITMSMTGLWGASGLIANHVLRERIAQNDSWAFISVGIALLASIFGTALLSRIVGRIAPTQENYQVNPGELVGESVTVVHDVSETFGMVRVQDKFHNTLDFEARAKQGSGPFRSGSVVRIAGVLPGNVFLVEIVG